MRKVSIRQFQQNFHKELADLPFVITRRGEDIAVVVLTANEVMEKMTEHVNAITGPLPDAMSGNAQPRLCEMNHIDQNSKCREAANHEFTVPAEAMWFGDPRDSRNVMLCGKHFKQIQP